MKKAALFIACALPLCGTCGIMDDLEDAYNLAKAYIDTFLEYAETSDVQGVSDELAMKVSELKSRYETASAEADEIWNKSATAINSLQEAEVDDYEFPDFNALSIAHSQATLGYYDVLNTLRGLADTIKAQAGIAAPAVPDWADWGWIFSVFGHGWETMPTDIRENITGKSKCTPGTCACMALENQPYVLQQPMTEQPKWWSFEEIEALAQSKLAPYIANALEQPTRREEIP